ncbi:MAG TPA: shikimate kinase [Thermodesulfobacteriota bacterium]|nr:shikimate kinase [Thermodesulfobacteriota bacterium]
MNITLIGMAGVGKSFIGQELATILHYAFIDIDELIEKQFNQTLQEIVDRFGEQRFLKIEEQAILGLGEIDRCVISPGGSAIYSVKAMEFLRKNSIVLFLDASFESIKNRVHNESTRGIIGLKKRKLRDLYRERKPLYQKYAGMTIKLPDALNRDVVVKEILQKLSVEGRKDSNGLGG